jgi:hypothetical protein
LRIVRSWLGRLIRDTGRKIAGQESIEAVFALLLVRASRIRFQQQRGQKKVGTCFPSRQTRSACAEIMLKQGDGFTIRLNPIGS